MIRIGTAGWAIPARTRDRFPEAGTGLERYAARFPVAEINSTFYRAHRPGTCERWAASVPDAFRFAVKLPKTITHARGLVGADDLALRVLDETSALGAKIGPLLIQLPPRLAFDAAATGGLLTLLRGRAGGPIACEPRHPSWFDGEADRLLEDFDVARVAADPARVPEAARPGGSGSLAYYRLHGSPRMYFSEYGGAYVEALARRLVAEPARETWCIFDNTASGAAAADALLLQDQLRQLGVDKA
jgi:uncharacterized protein YecE (DUF72 family)